MRSLRWGKLHRGSGNGIVSYRKPCARRALLSAGASARRNSMRRKPQAVERISLIKAANEREEALAVAVLLRREAESPGRVAALVTPDRGLARRVAVELKRWGIEVDDSAGRPLGRTPRRNARSSRCRHGFERRSGDASGAAQASVDGVGRVGVRDTQGSEKPRTRRAPGPAPEARSCRASTRARAALRRTMGCARRTSRPRPTEAARYMPEKRWQEARDLAERDGDRSATARTPRLN